MPKVIYIFSLIVVLMLAGCGERKNDFRLALFWGDEEFDKERAYPTDIITADDLAKISIKKRLALTRSNDRLGIKPTKAVIGSTVFEYYEIPSKHRTELGGKTNFGYIWVKPNESNKGGWTNTQLWVKTSALAEGRTMCNNIGSDSPWTFYLSGGACEAQVFDICDDSIPKLGLGYSEQYDIVFLSDTARVLNICD